MSSKEEAAKWKHTFNKEIGRAYWYRLHPRQAQYEVPQAVLDHPLETLSRSVREGLENLSAEDIDKIKGFVRGTYTRQDTEEQDFVFKTICDDADDVIDVSDVFQRTARRCERRLDVYDCIMLIESCTTVNKSLTTGSYITYTHRVSNRTRFTTFGT